MKNMFTITIGLLLILVLQLTSVDVTVSEAQVAENPQGDLWGKNMGDQIVFAWADHAGTSEYIVYRSASLAGPWVELARVREVAARTGGSKVDVTPMARLTDLCYKVEAVDANGLVIRTYQPMCVPKFVQ